MAGNEFWVVKGATAIYRNEEDAKVLSDFLNKDCGTIKPRYEVQKVYADCYVEKIKRGYDIYQVQMTREGEFKVKKAQRYAPNAYGFKRRSFNYIFEKVNNITYMKKVMMVYCLAKDEAEAVAVAEKERVKSLLDDIWKVKGEQYLAKAEKQHGLFYTVSGDD